MTSLGWDGGCDAEAPGGFRLGLMENGGSRLHSLSWSVVRRGSRIQGIDGAWRLRARLKGLSGSGLGQRQVST